jgi:hypothetical protein
MCTKRGVTCYGTGSDLTVNTGLIDPVNLTQIWSQEFEIEDSKVAPAVTKEAFYGCFVRDLQKASNNEGGSGTTTESSIRRAICATGALDCLYQDTLHLLRMLVLLKSTTDRGLQEPFLTTVRFGSEPYIGLDARSHI